MSCDTMYSHPINSFLFSVADEDDYFDYERPLDFVSRAERRKVLKEAGGDEEKANQLLMERANASSGTLIDRPEKDPIDVVAEENQSDDDESFDDDNSADDDGLPEKIVDVSMEENDSTPAPEQPSAASSEDSPKPKKKKKKKEPKKSKPPADDEDLDVLGLDDF